MLDQAILISLVPKVNGAVAVISLPFVLFDALAKKAGVSELKRNLDLAADQLLGRLVDQIEETLKPHWPKTISNIILEPTLVAEATAALSEAARDSLTRCMRQHADMAQLSLNIRSIAKQIHVVDKALYWTGVVVACLSIVDLLIWLVVPITSDILPLMMLLAPCGLVFIAIAIAARRQFFIQRAESYTVNI